MPNIVKYKDYDMCLPLHIGIVKLSVQEFDIWHLNGFYNAIIIKPLVCSCYGNRNCNMSYFKYIYINNFTD